MTSNKFWDQALRYSAFAILLAGVAMRINQFAANRSLWFDEALLALNIVRRSFLELLFHPLDYHQGAPPGFLFVHKLVVTVVGSEDFALRIFPMLSAFAALYLMYRVSDQYVGGIGGLVALGLFSFSDKLIYYASENKQYSTDVLCALVLLFSVGRCLEDDAGAADYLSLCILGAVSSFFSHPALFILSGVSAGLLFKGSVKKDRQKLLWTGRIFLVWFICYVVLYFVFLRPLASNTHLLKYWQSCFMPWPPWEDPSWFEKTFLGVMRNPAGLVYPLFFTLLLLAAGAVSFFYRKRNLTFVVVVPFIALLVASVFHKYPIGGRLVLFLLPLIYLLIAEAVEAFRLALRKLNRPWLSRICCILIIVYIFIKPVGQGIANIEKPNMKEHLKPVLAHVQENRLEDDGIYLYYGAVRAFSFYMKKYGFKEGDFVRGISSRGEPEKYLKDIERFAGMPRVWLIFSHTRRNEIKFIINSLVEKGILLKKFKAPGASAYLFDLSGGTLEKPLKMDFNSCVLSKPYKGNPLCMSWSGSLTTPIYPLKKNNYKLFVKAKGTKAFGEYAKLKIQILQNENDKSSLVVEKTVDTGPDFNVFIIPFEIKKDNNISFVVSFINDRTTRKNKEDRNAFLKSIILW